MENLIKYYVLLIGCLPFRKAMCSQYDFISYEYENRTEPAYRQLYDFKKQHPKPIGLFTTSSGYPVEIRETNALNSDLFSNPLWLDSIIHLDAEKIPERIVASKGIAALGYFEVTHDVSQYTKADVFNGIGKITPIIGRFSTAAQNQGGNDLSREPKGMAVKFYTNEGNLDLLCLNTPVYFYKDPQYFVHVIHATRRNPKTHLIDPTMRADIFSLRFESINGFLRLLSDGGIPNGYRKMDVFPIHTFEVNNKNGEKYYVKFNFRTEQGIENIPSEEALRIGARSPDYYLKDLTNAIERKNYPVWRLEMDVMSLDDVQRADYNPFEITRLWKKGTYRTVQIGRLVYNEIPDNHFRTSEQSAFNPGNLVPGIPGPVDLLFKGRRLAYPVAQNYRLGINHNKIDVNVPKYAKTYNRDGLPPVLHNMKDVPNFYPNSFSGPISYVDAARPKERIVVYESNAVDLQEASYYYRYILQSDGERDRLANNSIPFMLTAPPFLQERLLKLFSLVDTNFASRVYLKLQQALVAPPKQQPRVLKCDGEKRYSDEEFELMSLQDFHGYPFPQNELKSL